MTTEKRVSDLNVVAIFGAGLVIARVNFMLGALVYFLALGWCLARLYDAEDWRKSFDDLVVRFRNG